MTFVPGKSGNPMGRPRGLVGGRVQALGILDKLLGKKKCQASLLKALLEEEFDGDPTNITSRSVSCPPMCRVCDIHA